VTVVSQLTGKPELIGRLAISKIGPKSAWGKCGCAGHS
jgi:hypothetical protein